MGRTSALWGIGIFTVGMGLIVLPFSKKCVYCRHNMFLNNHSPYNEYPSQPQMVAQPQAQQPVVGAPINQSLDGTTAETINRPFPSRVERQVQPKALENPYPSRSQTPNHPTSFIDKAFKQPWSNGKMWFEQWWVWVVAIVMIGGIISSIFNIPEDSSPKNEAVEVSVEENKTEAVLEAQTLLKNVYSPSFETSYIETLSDSQKDNAIVLLGEFKGDKFWSKEGLYDQLVREKQMEDSEAKFLIDNLQIDWSKQAYMFQLKNSKYVESPEEMRKELEAAKFTAEEVDEAELSFTISWAGRNN